MIDLTDPVTVHANLLRGTIAKPTVEQIIHLYGREAFQPMIDAAVAKALEDACLAVSEHADWPEDEHGRTEQAGLFARVINAICAIAPAAPHVNETPKSEHDAGNVLTVSDLVGAGKVADRLRAEKSVISTTRTFPSGDERDMVLVPHYGPNPLAHEAADTIRALIALATAQAAQIAGLTKERDDLQEKMKLERFLTDRATILAGATQDEAATLRAEVERLRGALGHIESIAVHSGGEIHGVTGQQWKAAFEEAQEVARAALEVKI